jgi:hypothetical protein
MKTKVVLTIKGGIIDVEKCPADVKIVVKDYDLPNGGGFDPPFLKYDSDGRYVETHLT